jgi:hypothetical protein
LGLIELRLRHETLAHECGHSPVFLLVTLHSRLGRRDAGTCLLDDFNAFPPFQLRQAMASLGRLGLRLCDTRLRYLGCLSQQNLPSVDVVTFSHIERDDGLSRFGNDFNSIALESADQPRLAVVGIAAPESASNDCGHAGEGGKAYAYETHLLFSVMTP